VSLSLRALVEDGRLDPGWGAALADAQPSLTALEGFLRAEEAAGQKVLPAEPDILRAFRTPFADVRVLILGQDPYPTAGHPIGLAFAVDGSVRPLPRSLANIHRELRDDLGIEPPDHGDLTAWSRSGVLLLNRVLTVRAGATGSHRRRGWEAVTALAVRRLVERGGPLVAVLWGRDAQAVAPALGDVPTISSAHPSPLSARTGFFGSRPFSRANEALAAQGEAPVDWRLDPLPRPQ
jgi:uracil-DNA glycosylase